MVLLSLNYLLSALYIQDLDFLFNCVARRSEIKAFEILAGSNCEVCEQEHKLRPFGEVTKHDIHVGRVLPCYIKWF